MTARNICMYVCMYVCTYIYTHTYTYSKGRTVQSLKQMINLQLQYSESRATYNL